MQINVCYARRAGGAAQALTAKIEITLQMGEQHLDLPALASRLFERSGRYETGDVLAHLFMCVDGK